MRNYSKDFSAEVVRLLSNKGITVIDTVSIPDENGSFLNQEIAYRLNDNGTQILRRYHQVVTMAKSSYGLKP